MVRAARVVSTLAVTAGCFAALSVWFSCRSTSNAQAPASAPGPAHVEAAAESSVARIQFLSDLLAREPALPSLRLQLARVYREAYPENGEDAARRELLAALSVQPDDPDGLYELGRSLFSLRRYLSAAKWFERAAAERPSDWRAWYRAGMAYVRAGREATGLERLNEAVRLAPEEPGPRRLAAEAAARQGRLGESRPHFEWLARHEGKPEDRAAAESGLVLLDLAEGRYRGPAWDAVDPPGIGPLKLRTSAAFERGQHTPEPARQVEAYTEAVKGDPGMYQAPNNLGLALMALHDHGRAIPYFKQANELYRAASPKGAPKLDAQCNIALCYNRSGRPEDAMSYVDAVLAVEPDSIQALYAKGEVLVGLGRAREALEPLSRCMSMEPEHADAARTLGAVYDTLGDTELAIAMLQHAVWLAPDEDDRELIRQDIASLQSRKSP